MCTCRLAATPTTLRTHLIAEAELDSRVVGIHAAMGGGTGMNRFEQRFPERTFDVGIAEQVCARLACAILHHICFIPCSKHSHAAASGTPFARIAPCAVYVHSGCFWRFAKVLRYFPDLPYAFLVSVCGHPPLPGAVKFHTCFGNELKQCEALAGMLGMQDCLWTASLVHLQHGTCSGTLSCPG